MLQLKLKGGAIAALALAFMVAGANTALADGTQSGTVVLNTALVDYEVASVAQAQESASEDFTVDRKINLTVATAEAAYVSTPTNNTAAILRFTVQNTSNDTLGFALSAVNEAATTVEPVLAGTDEVDAVVNAAYHDVNGDGLLDAGDTLGYIDSLGIDLTANVIVVSTIPTAAVASNGDNIMVGAFAHAAEAGTLGATLVTASGADGQDTLETVFIDGVGNTVAGVDIATDARHSEMWAYVVQGANITVTKTAALVVGTYHIPGSTVEYTITVANGAGGQNATNVDLVDAVPANTTFVAGSLLVGGVAQTEAIIGDDAGDFNVSTAGAVSALNMTVLAGTNTVIVFRVTID